MPARRPSARVCSLLSIAALSAAAVLLNGCATGSGRVLTPKQRLDALQIDHDSYGRLGYRLDWTGFPVITAPGPVKAIEAYDDVVVVQEAGNTVSVLEASTGETRWSDQPAARLTRFVGIGREGNRLFVSSEAEVFILDLQTGNQLDRQEFEKLVSTEPVRADGLLIYGTGTGEILAHLLYSSVDGVKLWGYDMPGSIRANPVKVGEAIVGAVTQTGDLAFVQAADGQLVSRNRVYGGMATHPVADDQRMYIASLDQSLYAFEAATGAQVWRYRTEAPLDRQPTLHDGRLYIELPGEGLVAFDAATGEKLWGNKDVTGTVIGISRGDLLVWNGREAAVVDPARGDLIDRVSLPGVQRLELDRFADGNLYAVSTAGLVSKFVPRTLERAANASAPVAGSR